TARGAALEAARRARWDALVGGGRLRYPEALPITGRRDDLLAAIRDHQVVVVAGETGSGKTTQLPKLCLELGRGVRGAIAHTQPRRVAARTVAERIAEELGVALGTVVGYAVRFDDRTTQDTLVRVLTDGLLLAEIRRDRLLRRYDTVIVDEAHERSLNIDFLLGFLARLLPRRPDLKLVITSATIDPERFSRHFGGAPVVEVSGRTYPVEVRYRPYDEAVSDEVDAIGDAVDELLREGPGDVLVFLSGEREIRDAADALHGRFGAALDIVPLYARLAAADQRRAFRPGPRRRVVLATNVAETSVTVPGIRYVVDPGTARISRYSPRLKVQRLPIERVSQASAEQRKGRCGRTADGVCLRLYSEEDLAARPRFTDPEILRTSLAAVILQMAALELGDVERFGFLDPPDRRQVRDGVRLLEELGALRPGGGGLTAIGRRLATLPVDPRLARMVLEADGLGCADEVLVIAAALSIQDPRERPVDRRDAADAAHRRLAGEAASDPLALLELWRAVRASQRELSGSAFRRWCREHFLHALRVREWQDLVAQLRQAARESGVTVNRAPAAPDDVHRAMLAGLLSHLGLKTGDAREYLGARGARFALWPGSLLARRPPPWVMVAELVETSRLWGRVAAPIDPAWVEPVAGELARRRVSEPRWDRRRAAAVATERVTLYGLPVVGGRTVSLARTDPAGARELFLRRALVAGDWDTRHAFAARNRARIAEVEAAEERARRRGLLAGDEVLYAFFDERVPAGVVSGAHFDRWWRDERARRPELLDLPRELLVRGDIDDAGRPDAWRRGDLELPLSYRFEPGAEDDGVTVHVPLRALGRLRAEGFEWLVPALRAELVTALVRSLPKDVRRGLVPVPATVATLEPALDPSAGALPDALAAALERIRGVRVAPEDFDLGALPAHLRMRFSVEDDRGAVLATGRDLDALRAELRPRLRAELGAASASLERHGLRDWDGVGTLPRVVALPGSGGAVRAYPALVDEGDAVGVRALETPAAQAAAMRAGTRRLLLLTLPSPLRDLRARLGSAAQLTLATAPGGDAGAVLDDALAAAVDALVDETGGPAWDEAGFGRLRASVGAQLPARSAAVVDTVVGILDARRDVERRLEGLRAPAFEPARLDVARQLGRLVFGGFVAATPARRLADVERYLRAAERRLERLPDNVATDRDRMAAVHELEQAYRARVERWPRGRPLPASLREVPWLLEELRVSHFAQGLGVRGPVSSRRIRRA
ncbi:MAG TPA: ATP-dependent RNA helicase HrpA, partial [Solirubrobacteraceae bacterium]|nr:ATP-dependent RNA helicase HrpA [Solirubrobacteraceae bacterium]